MKKILIVLVALFVLTSCAKRERPDQDNVPLTSEATHIKEDILLMRTM